MSRVLILFVLGATLGPLGDWFHVISETTAYPSGVYAFYFGKQPYWVPLLFGAAGLAIGLSHPQMDRWLGAPFGRRGSRGIAGVIFGIAAFLGIYAMSAFAPLETGSSLDITIAAAAMLLWWAADRTWQGLLLAALTAAVGCAVEIYLVQQRAYVYLSPKDNFYGVASWLPWLYVAASVAVGNLGRFLQNPGSAPEPLPSTAIS